MYYADYREKEPPILYGNATLRVLFTKVQTGIILSNRDQTVGGEYGGSVNGFELVVPVPPRPAVVADKVTVFF